jgi:hypothetical protein
VIGCVQHFAVYDGQAVLVRAGPSSETLRVRRYVDLR